VSVITISFNYTILINKIYTFSNYIHDFDRDSPVSEITYDSNVNSKIVLSQLESLCSDELSDNDEEENE
jgi:hypothetical protein